MNNPEFTKAQKKEIRRLAGIAYERELSEFTGRLESGFGRWREGEIDVFELNDLIHQFHDGPSRDLYVKHVRGKPYWLVASAVACGLLKEHEVDPAVMDILKGSIEVARELAGDDGEEA